MDIPSWTMPGVVVERRELTTDKGAKKNELRVWAYSIKLMAMGGTYECMTREKQLYDSVGEGEQLIAHGHFDTGGGQLRLQVERFTKISAKGAA